MINAGTSGAPGAAAFPDPPTGSPGEISACARTLANAADDLEHAEGGLRGAGSALASDWQGYAAAAYHSSSQGLAAVAGGGAQTFRECAQAVSGYATALDHAQPEIRRLKTLYDDALRRQAPAASLAGRLVGTITAHTKPAEVTKVQTQATTADGQATDAGIEASGYARQATTALTDFKQASARYAAVLNGQQPGHPGGPFGSPFSAAGHPGPGFGAPFDSFTLPGGGSPTATGLVPGGLNAYAGVIPVGNPWSSPIPGYGYYKDATTPEAVPSNDLTNLVLLLAPLAAGPAGDLGESALRQLAESMGIGTGGRAAVDAAERKAFDETFAELRAAEGKSSSFPGILTRAEQAGRSAAATTEVGQREVTAGWVDVAIDAANRAGVLPAGAKEVLSDVAHRGWAYTSYAAAQLGAFQAKLIGAGGTAARVAANAIGAILRSGR